MNFKNLTLIGATLMLSANMFASTIPTKTYFGGFEDKVGGDYDYNDIVFSVSAKGLTLNSDSKFYAQPALNNSGTPFWNNYSNDQPSNAYNVGFCIYGGGACNGGTALDPGAKFLASSSSAAKSATDVTFSANGAVTATLNLGIAGYTDYLGYYTNDTIQVLGTAGNTYTFTPDGTFGLFGYVANTNTYFYSQAGFDASEPGTSHFAFFNTAAAPEPGMMGLVGAGLLSVGAFFRRKKSVQS